LDDFILDVHFRVEEIQAVEVKNGPVDRRGIAHLNHSRAFFGFEKFNLQNWVKK
jgi:hypothetical protein